MRLSKRMKSFDMCESRIIYSEYYVAHELEVISYPTDVLISYPFVLVF